MLSKVGHIFCVLLTLQSFANVAKSHLVTTESDDHVAIHDTTTTMTNTAGVIENSASLKNIRDVVWHMPRAFPIIKPLPHDDPEINSSTPNTHPSTPYVDPYGPPIDPSDPDTSNPDPSQPLVTNDPSKPTGSSQNTNSVPSKPKESSQSENPDLSNLNNLSQSTNPDPSKPTDSPVIAAKPAGTTDANPMISRARRTTSQSTMSGLYLIVYLIVHLETYTWR